MNTPTVYFDPNSPDLEGVYASLLEDAPDLRIGDDVLAVDDEGSGYPATVVKVDQQRRLILVFVKGLSPESVVTAAAQDPTSV